MIMDGSIQFKIYATIFRLAAEIERDFIAQRTREALARRKADGHKLSRSAGEAEKLGAGYRRHGDCGRSAIDLLAAVFAGLATDPDLLVQNQGPLAWHEGALSRGAGPSAHSYHPTN
jgi:hypothetical protein